MQQAKLSLFKSSALAAMFACLLPPLSAHGCPEHGASKSKTKSIDSKTLAKDTSKDLAKDTSGARTREGFNQPMILSGLKQMKLVIGELDQFSIDQGITKEKIRHLMVDELVPTHATICGDDNCCAGTETGTDKGKGCETSATPILYLKLKTAADSGHPNTATFAINMSLVEKVKVARNKQELMVAVWSKDAAGSSQSNIQAEVDSQLKEIVKHFRRDFALANSADIGHGKKHPMKKDDHSGMNHEQGQE